jgi:hypothetical protein
MADGDAQASLARIEAHLGHAVKQGDETRTTVEALRGDVADLKLQDGIRHERTTAAVNGVDDRLAAHERSDDRRFKGIAAKLDTFVPGALQAGGRYKAAATKGGLVVGGGAGVLAVLELLKLIGKLTP